MTDGEIAAELANRDIKCERPFCDNKAVDGYKVGKFLPFLCQEDIDTLNGPKTTWRTQIQMVISRDAERRWMESQVPVWMDREDRVARTPEDS